MKPLMLITGISGRIGRAAAIHFSSRYEVVGLDIRDYEAGLCIYADLSSKESVEKALNQVASEHGKQVATVLHFAAYYNFQGGKWEQYQAITIDGTRNLIEALRSFEVEQFVFSSTMLVYASSPHEKLKENSPLDPNWEYPLSKVKTEELIRAERSDIHTVNLRISGVYDDECNSIPIEEHIRRVRDNTIDSHFFPGNTSHGASFLHMSDLIDAVDLVVEKRGELPAESTFLLGEPDVMTYDDLQREIGLLVRKKPHWTLRIPKWMAKVGAWLQAKNSFIKPWMVDLADEHYEVDPTKAKEILGWIPKHSLKATLPKMVSALLSEKA